MVPLIAGSPAHVDTSGWNVYAVRSVVFTFSRGDELGHLNVGRGHVAIVGPNNLAGLIPLQEYLASRVRERNGAILADGRAAVRALLGSVKAQLVVRDGGRRERVA
ncbi:unnamed protein product [Clonostachys chloroleuca]|uniref:Uncharacterized protein n=1 Tax=Clonostachys chloroleuca TaxID=1926264 RepID=A0AA35LQB4_9HYPO|nr:unnamed protein product [Clonostachys chloroleuca]